MWDRAPLSPASPTSLGKEAPPGPAAPACGPFSAQPLPPAPAASAARPLPAAGSAAPGTSQTPAGPACSAPSSAGSAAPAGPGPVWSRSGRAEQGPTPSCFGRAALPQSLALTSAMSLSRAFRSLSHSSSRFSQTCLASSLGGERQDGEMPVAQQEAAPIPPPRFARPQMPWADEDPGSPTDPSWQPLLPTPSPGAPHLKIVSSSASRSLSSCSCCSMTSFIQATAATASSRRADCRRWSSCSFSDRDRRICLSFS